MSNNLLRKTFKDFFNTRSRIENPDAALAGRTLNKVVQTLNDEMSGILKFEIDRDSIAGSHLKLDCTKMDTGTSVQINIACELDVVPPAGYPKTGIHSIFTASEGNHSAFSGPINDEDDSIRFWAESVMTLVTCQLAEAEKALTQFDVFRDAALA